MTCHAAWRAGYPSLEPRHCMGPNPAECCTAMPLQLQSPGCKTIPILWHAGGNVMALLAMSRELMVTQVQEYCTEYSQTSLDSDNAIQYLSQAVQFNCDTFRESCLSLVAADFPSSCAKNTDGLPIEVSVQCKCLMFLPTRTTMLLALSLFVACTSAEVSYATAQKFCHIVVWHVLQPWQLLH